MQFGADKRTRVQIFMTNVSEVLPTEPPSSFVSVKLIDGNQQSYTLVVEHVDKVSGLGGMWSLVALLPNDSALAGDVSIKVKWKGVDSNSAVFAIRPGPQP
jgi:hypothetical protein